ncbi:DUF1259 domain-containing protein [Jiella sp. M17.18]|uniref:DUF1259 domain-containing protein n=1 Tax=Jiella sp. M17.18 TaxID=3234247 RepID=UPI0034E03274
MTSKAPTISMTRRHALAVGGGLILSASAAPAVLAQSSKSGEAGQSGAKGGGDLPQKRMEDILQADGKMKNGILGFEVGRKDLDVKGHGIPFKPSWQVLHEFYFQSIGGGKAIFNGDMAMVAGELNPVIDEILSHGLVFEAEHQHFYGLSPQIWHIHLRGQGDPINLAEGVAAAMKATGVPLPQKSEKNPKTPLDAKKLGEILGGDAEVKEDGVVTVKIPRKEQMTLGGRNIIPLLNVETHVDFQPLEDKPSSGSFIRTAVAPDFAMTTDEIGPLMTVMRNNGFEVHCLYNQETGESPQLFFSHQLAIGDPEKLARIVRKGLDKTNSKFKS